MSVDDLENSNVQSAKLYLGCHAWSCPAWPGQFLADGTPQRDYLAQYSTAFNTVEGNTTFYAMPTLDKARRWAAEAAVGFRFALKFPREISHDKQLFRVERETKQFLEALQILQNAKHLGPSFLQLPPTFAGHQFSVLEAYLKELVKEDVPLAVEVRHPDYFDSGDVERRLNDLLIELEIDRVIFDSRALFSAPPTDETEIEAQKRKPRSQLHRTVTGKHPFLRLIGRNDLTATQPWLEEWAPVVADWLQRGLTPYVFAHTPNDAFAPAMARAFHQELRKHVPNLPELPLWPQEKRMANRAKQKTLF